MNPDDARGHAKERGGMSRSKCGMLDIVMKVMVGYARSIRACHGAGGQVSKKGLFRENERGSTEQENG